MIVDTDNPIIRSVLDNDMYKFTMQNAVINLFPRSKTRFQYINRGGTSFPKGFSGKLKKEIEKMSLLRLTEHEVKWLKDKCEKYLPPTYVDFLSGFRYDPSEVNISQSAGNLVITIEGYWYRTILWEVPLMALISELYFKESGQEIYNREERRRLNLNKAISLKESNIYFADFGTRRRYSYRNQLEVVDDMITRAGSNFVGTSNLYIAFQLNITPIGTHAHEWFQYHAAEYGFKMANRMALDNWVNVYRGNLGIALSDTFTSNNFFENFDTKLAKLFDGVRWDSGDVFEFIDKVINHYEKLGIDPTTKTIVFSDGLNVAKSIEIHKYCYGKIRDSYGIGTHLTNDVGVKPLNQVIKMVQAKPYNHDWIDTIKLSDDIGKHTGNPKMIELAQHVLNIK